MKPILLLCCFCGIPAAVQAAEPIPNPLIDYHQFQRIVLSSESQRESRRLTEDQFLKEMHEPDVVILDARTESRYRMRHIQGAVNLPFTEFTKQTLAQVIPSTATKVLIYCNNNFSGDAQAFASKAPAASLNLSTYTSLRAYGYTNLYELGPLLNIEHTRIPFAAGNEIAVADPSRILRDAHD